MKEDRGVRAVLCYGDSNTFGASTANDPDGRYAPHERWPGVLRTALGDGWMVIEEGLGGRTTVEDDTLHGPDKNGRTYLGPCVMSHRPLDLIIIMLGTNDLKTYFNKSAADIADGIDTLLADISDLKPGRNESIPDIIVVSPPAILDKAGIWDGVFEGGREKSLLFAMEYARVAAARGVRFFDAGSAVQSSNVDAIHLDRAAHAQLGEALAVEITRTDRAKRDASP